MLKAVLKDKDTTGRFLLNFGDTTIHIGKYGIALKMARFVLAHTRFSV